MRSWRLPIRTAFTMLHRARPIVDPNNGFRKQLNEWNERAQCMRYLCGLDRLQYSEREERMECMRYLLGLEAAWLLATAS
jgi:hypothetical protein